jgi:hypothetical protein
VRRAKTLSNFSRDPSIGFPKSPTRPGPMAPFFRDSTRHRDRRRRRKRKNGYKKNSRPKLEIPALTFFAHSVGARPSAFRFALETAPLAKQLKMLYSRFENFDVSLSNYVEKLMTEIIIGGVSGLRSPCYTNQKYRGPNMAHYSR